MRLPLLSGLAGCVLISSTAAIAGKSPQKHCLNHARLLSSHIACSTSRTEHLIFPVRNLLSDPLLIEKTAALDLNPFHPWTYEPFCTPVLEDVGSPLCVYTDTSFAQGRGISIFSTPQIASEFASLPPFQEDPSTIISQDDAGIKINTFSKSWTTQAIPSKGIGMLAARDLKRGDLVMAYTPIFIAFPENTLSNAERERFWRRAVDQLPAKSKEMYLGLSTIFGDERFKAQDVLKANTFEVQVGGVMHLAVWPETARVNHGCGPNSQYRIDHSRLVHYVHAARPISKGEEITITYINPFLPHAERQQTLQQTFHFACTCPRCTSGFTSDTALARISTLQTLLSDWSTISHSHSDSDSRKHPRENPTPQKAEELIALYKSEGLDGFLDGPYGHATLAYSAAGDAEGVRRYALLAGEAVGLKDGRGRGDWNLWEGMGREPRGHWSWRMREKGRKRKKGGKGSKGSKGSKRRV